MIKRMGLFQRRQDLTLTQFSAYWGKKHSPLVMQMPKFLQYTQNHRMDWLPNFTANHHAFEIDGIAEMYWNNEHEMNEDFNQHQAIDLLRQDETEFMSHISVCLVKEGELQGKIGTLKLILCLSEECNDLKVSEFLNALPSVQGVQISIVEQVFKRPQLPELSAVPNMFVNLWFDDYADVKHNFEAESWHKFYVERFSEVERISILAVCALPIRKIKNYST